jgi:hypothetical protein
MEPMTPTRRGFLGAVLSTVCAAAAIDPERLVWLPGKRLISIPKPRPRSRHLIGVDMWLPKGFYLERNVYERYVAYVAPLEDELLDRIRAFELKHTVKARRVELEMPQYGFDGTAMKSVKVPYGRVLTATDIVHGQLVMRADCLLEV